MAGLASWGAQVTLCSLARPRPTSGGVRFLPSSPPTRRDPACCVWGGVARAAREKAGELSGARGEERLAGQYESAAAGAEAAQPARGPGGGDCAPPLPRPHQRGGPAGKPRPPGVGGGQRRACGGSPGPWGSRSACHVLWTRAVVFRWNALPYPFHVLQNNCQPPRSFLRATEQCWRKLHSFACHWRALPSLCQWISASSLFRVLCSLLCPSPTQLQPLETLSTPHTSHPTAPHLSFGPQSSVGENCTALSDTGMLAHFYLSGSLQALFFMFSAAFSPILLLSCSRLKPCPHLTPRSSPHSSRCRLTSSLTVKMRGRLRLPVKRLILLLLWTACSVFSLIIRTFLWKKPVSSHFSLHSRPFCWFLP